MTIENNQPGEMLTLEEIGKLLKLSRSTIYRRRKQDNWPHIQIGSEFRFTPEDVEQIIALYRKETPTKQDRTRPNVGTKAKRRHLRQPGSRGL